MKTIVLTALSLLLAGSSGADNLLPNGSFNRPDPKTGFAESWQVERRNATGAVTIEPGLASRPALQLNAAAVTADDGWIAGVTQVRFAALPTPRILDATLKVAALELVRGGVVLSGGTRKAPRLFQFTLWQGGGDFTWKTVTAAVNIPAGTEVLNYAVRNYSAGILWVDDCTLNWRDGDATTSPVVPAAPPAQ